MKLAIIGVGKLREKYFRQAADEYEKRLGRYAQLEEIEIADRPEPANSSDAVRQRIMEEEGKDILARIREDDLVFALCIQGKEMDSLAFAERLSELAVRGRRIVFVIGGSLGLSRAVLKRADYTLSFSPMTFPHQLARIMLLEQIYRACKIQAGERYHK